MRRLWLILAAMVAACSGIAGSGSYQLGEFFIDGPTTLSEGTAAISVENSGEFPHTLVVSAPDGRVITATDLVMPGEAASLPLELDPGVYQFTCRIVGQDGEGRLVDHYERGMLTTVTVQG